MMDQLMGKTRTEDYIEKHGQTQQFKNYIKQNFDMKNISKYLVDEPSGLFSFEYLQKVYFVSFVWKNLLFDQMKVKLLMERRQCFKTNDNSGYRKAVKEMEKLEEKVFQSVMQKCKTETQILDKNFETTNKAFMKREECKKAIEETQK